MQTYKTDYKKMYALLFGAISDALDILPHYPENENTRTVLQNALLTAEEWYISATDTDKTEEN